MGHTILGIPRGNMEVQINASQLGVVAHDFSTSLGFKVTLRRYEQVGVGATIRK